MNNENPKIEAKNDDSLITDEYKGKYCPMPTHTYMPVPGEPGKKVSVPLHEVAEHRHKFLGGPDPNEARENKRIAKAEAMRMRLVTDSISQVADAINNLASQVGKLSNLVDEQ